jgi:carbon starvation protein
MAENLCHRHRLGFLSAAKHFEKLAASGRSARDLAGWQHQIFNNYLNASVTALFLILVLLIVASCARVWMRLLAGRHEEHPLREEPSVA